MAVQQNRRSFGGIPRSQSDYGGFSFLPTNKRSSIGASSIYSIEIHTRPSSILRLSPCRRLSTNSELSTLQDEDIQFLAAANHIFPQRMSSMAPSTATTTRPSSKLPRPIRSSTPFRDPATPTPVPLPRLKMYTQHKMRMSMTTNDLAALQEETTPREERKDLRRRSDIASPSKLPRRVIANVTTPSLVGKGLGGQRYVSTPVSLPSHKKENVVPIGLLRPVSPTQAHSQVHAHVQALQPQVSAKSQFQHVQRQPDLGMHPTLPSIESKSNIPHRLIPKSRTFGMLSSLRSSIRRSASSLNFDHKSRNSSISSAATTSTKTVDSFQNTIIVEEVARQCIYGYHSTGFWAGRFSSVHDRLHNELLEASLGDEDSFQSYISHIGSFPALAKPTTDSINTSKNTTSESALYRDETPFEQLEKRRFTSADEDARCKRVFEQLNMYCGDEGAKKSLFTFQLQFARIKGKSELLPEGGKMEPLLERWGKKVEGAFGKRLSGRLG